MSYSYIRFALIIEARRRVDGSARHMMPKIEEFGCHYDNEIENTEPWRIVGYINSLPRSSSAESSFRLFHGVPSMIGKNVRGTVYTLYSHARTGEARSRRLSWLL